MLAVPDPVTSYLQKFDKGSNAPRVPILPQAESSTTQYEPIHDMPFGTKVKKTLVFRWGESPQEHDDKQFNPESLVRKIGQSIDASSIGAKLFLTDATIKGFVNSFPDSINFDIKGMPVNHEIIVSDANLNSANNGTSFIIPPTGGQFKKHQISIFSTKNSSSLKTPLKYVNYDKNHLDQNEILYRDNEGKIVILDISTPSAPKRYHEVIEILKQEGVDLGTTKTISFTTTQGIPKQGLILSTDAFDTVQHYMESCKRDSKVFEPSDVAATITPVGHSSFRDMVVGHKKVGTGIDYISHDPLLQRKNIVEVHVETESIVLNNQQNNLVPAGLPNVKQ